jgi:hypothetical protein
VGGRALFSDFGLRIWPQERAARVARVLREAHPRQEDLSAECFGNCAGMVLVKESGLVMKLRGMIQKLALVFCARTPLFFSSTETFFLFPFDRGWSFL